MAALMLIFILWLIVKIIRTAFRFSWGLFKLATGILLFTALPLAVFILLVFGFTALLLLPLGMLSFGLPAFRRGNYI